MASGCGGCATARSIREAAPELFYLDEEVWQALGRTRRRVSVAVLALMVFLIIGVLAVKRLIAPS